MKISDILVEKTPHLSFEVFPPKTDAAYEGVLKATEAIAELKPSYMSVTYGAGGGTSKNTVKIASHIKDKYNVPSLAHLTCVSSTKEEVHQVIDQLKASGIENILALRGDIPQECENKIGEFSHANDLIKYIKEYGDFSIGGAFYPEGHQETNDLLDLFNLKTKVDSGTDFLISQIFFENEKFYEFKEKLGKLNIKTPLIAGVMPITNGKQIRRITSMCGCSIPEKLKKILDRYEDNPIAMREAGIAYAMEQIIELISDDIAGIHIYTMNRVEASKKIMENIGNILRKRDENYGY